MKILFICGRLGNGGAQRVTSLLTDRLCEAGNQVYILAFGDSENAYQYNKKVTIVHYQGKKNKWVRIKEIRRCIKENSIDTIIAFSHYNAMYSYFASLGINVRLIASERNDPAQLEHSKAKNWLRSKIYETKKVENLVCQTVDAKMYFSKKIQDKSVIIMNPLNSKNLPSPYNGVREHRIVSFSRFEPQKNIPMLIRSFEKVHEKYPDYVLDLYGEGAEKNRIEEIIRDKKLEGAVVLHPFDKNIHETVNTACMFALASDYEGLSNSMIESMAIGLPVVVTDCPCGGARMVIKDGINGFLVPVGDPETMYERMIYIIENQEKAREISRNATKIKETLDSDKICKQWLELF